jgi:hypothetical protein
MKIYRVHIRQDEQGTAVGPSAGYEYFSNRKEALKAFAKGYHYDDSDLEQIDVEISKGGILRALNTYGGHPDNG